MKCWCLVEIEHGAGEMVILNRESRKKDEIHDSRGPGKCNDKESQLLEAELNIYLDNMVTRIFLF